MQEMYIGGNLIVTDKIMRERDPNDFYETESELIVEYFKQHPVDMNNMHVMDLGAGRGVWGTAIRSLYPNAYISGIELQEQYQNPGTYDAWYTANFLYDFAYGQFDIILGNPPYKYAEAFYHNAYLNTKPNSYIIFLLRLCWLASQGRFDRMYNNNHKPELVTVLSKRPSFTGDGKTYPDDFAVYRWHLSSQLQESRLDWMTYSR